MIMSYLLKNRSEKKSSFFRNFLLIVFLGILLNSFFANPISSLTRNIFSPFWKIKEKVFRSDSLEGAFRTKKSIIAENERIEAELARAKLDLLSFDALQKENSEMRQALGALLNRESVWTNIIARPPVSLYDTFVVAHQSNKLVLGQKALAYGAIPVGEVVEVGKNTALVRLYSASGNRFPVLLGGSSETVEIVGVGGGNFEIRVPKSVPIAVSDKIHLPGSTSVLGVVEAVEEQESDSFKTVFVRSPVNIFKITAVEILI
jgi:cell shape-determining protein MreC